jgi:hypothetical protein
MSYPTEAVVRALPPSLVRLDLEGQDVKFWPVGVLLEQRATSSLCHLRLSLDEPSAQCLSQLVLLTAGDPHKRWTLHLTASGESGLQVFASDWLKLLRANGGRSSLTDLSLSSDVHLDMKCDWPEVITIDQSLVSLRLDFEVMC